MPKLAIKTQSGELVAVPLRVCELGWCELATCEDRNVANAIKVGIFRVDICIAENKL